MLMEMLILISFYMKTLSIVLAITGYCKSGHILFTELAISANNNTHYVLAVGLCY